MKVYGGPFSTYRHQVWGVNQALINYILKSTRSDRTTSGPILFSCTNTSPAQMKNKQTNKSRLRLFNTTSLVDWRLNTSKSSEVSLKHSELNLGQLCTRLYKFTNKSQPELRKFKKICAREYKIFLSLIIFFAQIFKNINQILDSSTNIFVLLTFVQLYDMRHVN